MADFNFNQVTIGGKLTKDPFLHTTMSGSLVTAFNVVINKRREACEAQSVFVRVVAWGHIAEFIVRHFKRGSSICVVGSLSSRFWIDCNGERQQRTEICAQEVFLIDSASTMQLSFLEKVPGDKDI